MYPQPGTPWGHKNRRRTQRTPPVCSFLLTYLFDNNSTTRDAILRNGRQNWDAEAPSAFRFPLPRPRQGIRFCHASIRSNRDTFRVVSFVIVGTHLVLVGDYTYQTPLSREEVKNVHTPWESSYK